MSRKRTPRQIPLVMKRKDPDPDELQFKLNYERGELAKLQEQVDHLDTLRRRTLRRILMLRRRAHEQGIEIR